MSTHENEKALEVDREAAPVGAQAVVDDPQRQLPPELRIRVSNLQPGDANTLVTLTRQYPDFIDAILTQARSSAGNHTVSQAISMLAANPVVTEAVAPVRGRPPQIDYSPEGFNYEESVLTLEGGDVIEYHLKFIKMYPELRNKVLDGLLRAHPGLFDEALDRLREVEQAKAPVTETVAPVRGRPPQIDYSPEGFKYEESVLTLEGGDVIDYHLKFIKMYPELRSPVLSGLLRAHPGLFDEALDRLRELEQTKAKGPTEKELTEQQQDGSGAEAESQERTAKPKEEAKESAWIAGAKRFNAAHAEEVAEFNRVTKDACLGPEGVVDPALVSDWQVAHGVQPDGRVGPATVDAARRAAGIGRPVPITDEALADLQ